MNKSGYKNNDSSKIKAIKTLLRHGSRGSEWQEAGLLRAIEDVINDKSGLSSSELKVLMERAKDW